VNVHDAGPILVTSISPSSPGSFRRPVVAEDTVALFINMWLFVSHRKGTFARIWTISLGLCSAI
jgi:hypothetical protein